MTIKNLYPKSRPATIYNVINGRPELPAASTFSRASKATYFGNDGVLRVVQSGEPRFDYDPLTSEFKGLLLEEEKTNFVLYSLIQQSPWGPTSAIILDHYFKRGLTFQVAQRAEDTSTSAPVFRGNGINANDWSTASFYVDFNRIDLKQSEDPDLLYFSYGFSGSQYMQVTVTTNGTRTSNPTEILSFTNSGSIIPPNSTFSYEHIGDNIWLLSLSAYSTSTQGEVFFRQGYPDTIAWGGWQIENGEKRTSLIPTDSSTLTRTADQFSLTSSNNFDNGFSLLLDSETTTEDFLYKIKSGPVGSKTVIASLTNDGGTLDWNVNGKSAAINGEYPQVGFTPGRVRTVSSFGPAGQGDQLNYLYTTGLSFPTTAAPGSGANELEFGVPQTLKALYLWNGQLSNDEAVSVIKGEYNVVPAEPIKVDSYSFVYNTDPTNVGEDSITLPYIVPTISMRVYWGDGKSSRHEQGVTPSHTYPYPGQYRIQVVADDGFDDVRLGYSPVPTNSITRVDQWAPQHRVGTSGDGFTGGDMTFILTSQGKNNKIPPFKYTDLTDLSYAFYESSGTAANGWDWVPVNLPVCTNLTAAFTYSAGSNTETEKTTFPQLKTSSALKTVDITFRGMTLKSFPTNGLPFSDTSGVTSWSGTFSYMQNLTTLGNLDIGSATSLNGFLRGSYRFNAMPSLDYSNVLDMQDAFNQCIALAEFPLPSASNQTSKVTNFSGTWQECTKFTSFPLMDTSNGTNFNSAWFKCESLESFPEIDTSSGTTFINTWKNCQALEEFPLLPMNSAEQLAEAWSGCQNLKSFPLLTTLGNVVSCRNAWLNCSNLTSFPNLSSMTKSRDFSYSWYGCTGLTSFPKLTSSEVGNFSYAWQICNNLATFPKLDFSKCVEAYRTWKSCSSLTTVEANMFDTLAPTIAGYAFFEAFSDCALTAQSIENILVSLDTSGKGNSELGVDGGTNAAKSTWTAAANTAYTNLIGKGWTITFNA